MYERSLNSIYIKLYLFIHLIRYTNFSFSNLDND